MGQAPLRYINQNFITDPTLVIAGDYNIVGWTLINKSTIHYDVTVRIYDAAASGDVEPGVTDSIKTLLVPAGPGTNQQSNEDGAIQVSCSKGIVVYACRGVSTGDEVSLSTGVFIELLYLPNQ